jgi:hypothetical protein
VRLGLHARQLSLAHPISGTPLDLLAPAPDDLAEWLAQNRQSETNT